MKDISVTVGSFQIRVQNGHFTMTAPNYQGNITCEASEDLKNALISFTALLIETEE